MALETPEVPHVEDEVVGDDDVAPLEAPADDVEDLKKEEFEKEEDEEDYGIVPKEYMDLGKKLIIVASAVLLVVYLLAAFIIDFHRAIALFVGVVLCAAYGVYLLICRTYPDKVDAFFESFLDFMESTDTDRRRGLALAIILITIMITIMAATVESFRNLVSLYGLIVYVGLTWLFSWKPRAVKLRPILGGIFMQFLFGYAVIRTSWGFAAIEFLADIFVTLLGYTLAGSQFVYAWLTDGSLFGRPFLLESGDSYFLGPPFFFNVLPTVIFFSSLMAVGYYLRVMPWLVKHLGYFLAVLLGTSASESLSAAGNIFLGQTEAPLLVRPFIKDMTESELHAIMTGGFATIAGSVFGVYISFGIDATALLAASVMSAPAALAISKVSYPETEESATSNRKKGAYEIPPSDDFNVVDAATKGAVVGTQLVLNIAGNLIAFLAIIEMIDQLIIYLGDRVDIEISLNIICEYLFYPFAWLMGVDPDDCRRVGSVIGFKIIANEFVAYDKLAALSGEISDRSFVIASYALAGFSNLSSIGIQLGGLTPMAPNQGNKLAKVAFSAMIAGNTACFMTACIAGIFYEGDDNEGGDDSG